MPQPITRNTLFYGDNLTILREYVPTESVDLIYLDPPFNSSRSYNVLFKEEGGLDSEAQITAFEDTWHWGETAEATRDALSRDPRVPLKVATAINALFELIGRNQMMAYLVMMTARLVELHRVLKPTGSLYLHCDPTASHYLKVVLDAIFGGENFLNEIVWKRTSAHSSAKKYGPIHDIILTYSKSNNEYVWNEQFTPYDQSYVDNFYRHVDENGRRFRLGDITGSGIRNGETGMPWRGVDVTSRGRHWMYPPSKLEELDREGRVYWPPKGTMPAYKRYLDEMQGVALQDIWDDIQPVQSQAAERLGYPTQKPVALLERIIAASSNPGDVVLDPFAGCGTAIAAAHRLGRRWLGIDITHLSIALLKYRLEDAFDLKPRRDYAVIGEPVSVGDARQLAEDNRHQFEWWALSLVQARPAGGEAGSKRGRKGADQGIDGVITFVDDDNATPKRILVQVKSGHVQSGFIRDLVGTLDREKAAMGVLITLEPPTGPMVKEALSAGLYYSESWGRSYPRVQLLSIEELLSGERVVEMPPQRTTFKQARREKDSGPEQGKLL